MLNLENFPMLNSQNNMDDEALMDAYLDKIKHEYKDAWTEENWEEEIEKHPMFMTKMPDNEAELPPMVEALQKLQWEADDTPSGKFKDTNCFFLRNFSWNHYHES